MHYFQQREKMTISLDNLTNPAEFPMWFLDECKEMPTKDYAPLQTKEPAEGSNKYLIPVGDTLGEKDRLGALEAVYNGATISWLKDQKLPESGNFLDIGCAQGGLTTLFAQNFPQFKYVAIDNKEAQIAKAREITKESGEELVDWEVCDVDDMSPLFEKYPDRFSVVFSRLTLTHHKDPAKAIRNILEMVRPGGVVIIHERSLRTKYMTPKLKALESWGKMVVVQHRLQGSHKDTTERVFTQLARSDKVASVKLKYLSFPMESEQQKSLFRRGVEQGVAILPTLGIPNLMQKIGYEDGQTWVEEIRAIEEDPSIKCYVKDFACIAARVK